MGETAAGYAAAGTEKESLRQRGRTKGEGKGRAKGTIKGEGVGHKCSPNYLGQQFMMQTVKQGTQSSLWARA